MRDILVRLAHSHPKCTCSAWFGEPHGELCILQIVLDAEAEILRLRNPHSKSSKPDTGGNL